jgi:D-alanyl-D-alanine carboxypeptidase/D-alanyl-D-alanine-endopeptidase (penicillin-binding protein 4)
MTNAEVRCKLQIANYFSIQHSAFSIALAALTSTGCASHSAPATTPLRPDSAAVRQLRDELSTIFNSPLMARGVWGVDIRWVDSGAVLFQQNADRLMMPASNMKILTLAAAAQTLGWDHRFSTFLEASAPIEAGTLKGDLVIRGTGDPTISTRGKRSTQVFDEWAQALRAAGISTIEGRVIGDDQAFDDEGLGAGWAWDYLEAGYASPIGALQYNENVAELIVSAGAVAGDPAIVRIEPGSGLTIVNRARTVPAAEEARGTIDVRRRIDRAEIEVAGTIPAAAAVITRTVAVVNPTLFFAQGVRDALVSRGINVAGEAADGDDLAAELLREGASARRVLHETASPTLLEIATVLMKVSQNQYGETLLKAIGGKRSGLGTTRAGRAAAAEVFTSWSIPEDAYVMSDGSGLSRYNYVAPSMVTAVLRRMYSDPQHRDRFLASLPIAGKDGTIATRMKDSRASENALAKTGSIANVRSLSGYVRTRDGETVTFSIIANDFVIPAATVNWMADVAVETLANFKRATGRPGGIDN